jgi:hypothetical protein
MHQEVPVRIAALGLAALIAAAPLVAQDPDPDRTVRDGGIKVPGWKGRVDRRPLAQGRTINDSRFVAENGGFRLSVGPAAFYWNPANTASGEYEVKATFKEHRMAMQHPHAYGIFIAGANLESDTETLLYCIVYGDGTYAFKTFHGPQVSNLVAREAHPAINKAINGEATNEVAVRVRGGRVACLVNGTEVKSFSRSEVVGPDRLLSTDGIYGIRVSHNVEVSVTGLRLTRF